jgi:hypothetical protein
VVIVGSDPSTVALLAALLSGHYQVVATHDDGDAVDQARELTG